MKLQWGSMCVVPKGVSPKVCNSYPRYGGNIRRVWSGSISWALSTFLLVPWHLSYPQPPSPYHGYSPFHTGGFRVHISSPRYLLNFVLMCFSSPPDIQLHLNVLWVLHIPHRETRMHLLELSSVSVSGVTTQSSYWKPEADSTSLSLALTHPALWWYLWNRSQISALFLITTTCALKRGPYPPLSGLLQEPQGCSPSVTEPRFYPPLNLSLHPELRS